MSPAFITLPFSQQFGPENHKMVRWYKGRQWSTTVPTHFRIQNWNIKIKKVEPRDQNPGSAWIFQIKSRILSCAMLNVQLHNRVEKCSFLRFCPTRIARFLGLWPNKFTESAAYNYLFSARFCEVWFLIARRASYSWVFTGCIIFCLCFGGLGMFSRFSTQ